MNAAVLDNTALRCLYELELLNHLNLFYHTVWIPREVENEFLNVPDLNRQTERFNFLFLFYEIHTSWFKRCQVYNEDNIEIFLSTYSPDEKKLHRGEVEAIVQQSCLPGSDVELISDDRHVRNFLTKEKIPQHGTLYVLAKMDVIYQLCKYRTAVDKLIKEGQRFNPKVVNQVYVSVKCEFSS